jgi:hypothetical protein
MHKRRANDMIQLCLGDRRSEPIGFFCECSAPTCFETVWLTGSEFSDRRADAQWGVVAPSHRADLVT